MSLVVGTPSGSITSDILLLRVCPHKIPFCLSTTIIQPSCMIPAGVRPLGATATFTTNFGAKMRFNFTGMPVLFHIILAHGLTNVNPGMGLSWVSFIPTELSHNSTSATYSMNGENPFSSMACHKLMVRPYTTKSFFCIQPVSRSSQPTCSPQREQ